MTADVLERVLKKQEHVLEIRNEKYKLSVSRCCGNGQNEPLVSVSAKQIDEPANFDSLAQDNLKNKRRTIITEVSSNTSHQSLQNEGIESSELKTAIRVEKVANLDMKVLLMYFESEKWSGGGEIANEEEMDQYWVLTFKDEAVSHRVLSRSDHEVNNIPLVCSAFIKNPIMQTSKAIPLDPKRVLLSGFIKPVEKHFLALYVEACSATGEFQIEDTDNNISKVITFLTNVDIECFIECCGKREFNKECIKAQQLPMTNCVLIENLPEHVDESEVRLYLESMPGPGVKVQNVKLETEDDTAIIHLNSIEDAEKLIKGKLKLKENQLIGHRFYESNGLFILTEDERGTQGLEPHELKVDPILMEFISLHPEDSDKLQEQLKTHQARFMWPAGSAKDVMRIVPAYADNQVICYKLRRCWSKSVAKECIEFFNKYKRCSETFNDNTFEAIVEKVSPSLQERIQIIPDKTNFHIMLVGLKDDVELFQGKLSKLHDDIRLEMQRIENLKISEVTMRKCHLDLFKIHGLEKLIMQEFPGTVINFDLDKNKILIEGPNNSANEVKSKIMEVLIQCSENILDISQEIKTFLMQLNNEEFIQYAFCKNGIRATMSERGKDITLIGASDDDLIKAEKLFHELVVQIKVNLKEEFDLQKKPREWEEFVEGLKKKKELSMVGITGAPFQIHRVFQSDKDIILTGLRDVIKTVEWEITDFVENNIIVTYFFPLKSLGALSYLDKYCDVASQLPDCSKVISQKHTSNVYGYNISSKAKDKEKNINILEQLSARVISKTVTIQKPGAAKYLRGQGKLIMAMSEIKHKCIILIDQPKDQQGTDLLQIHTGQLICQITLNKITVSVQKGDLQHHCVDVVVNAANRQLNHAGGLAKSLLDAGGKIIQDESDIIVHNKGGILMEGDAVFTKAGALPCKALIHAIGPDWDSNLAEIKINTLKQTVHKSLRLAADKKYESIAIPAISSGIFEFPLQPCCETIMSTVKEFCETDANDSSTLKDIRLVNNDDITVMMMKESFITVFGQKKLSSDFNNPKISNKNTFEKDFTKLKKTGLHTFQSSSSQAEYKRKEKGTTAKITKSAQPQNRNLLQTFEGLDIQLIKGNIENEQVDVIVNTVSNDLDLSYGGVSSALLEKAGPQLQMLTTAISGGQNADDGDVIPIKIKECKLKCREVYQTVCCHWDESIGETVLRKIISSCLQMAHKSKYRSVVFPAIGTGNLNFPRAITACIFFDELVDFSKKYPKTPIQSVRIVVFGKDESTYAAFQKELNTRKEDRKHGGVQQRFGERERDLSGEFAKGKAQDWEMVRESEVSTLKKDDPYLDPSQPHQGSLQIMFGKVTVEIIHGNINDYFDNAACNRTDTFLGSIEVPYIDYVALLTGPGNLQCNYYIRVNKGCTQDELSRVFSNTLLKLEDQGMTSISMPLIGTGVQWLTAQQSAEALFDSVSEFSTHKKPKKLNIIQVMDDNQGTLPAFHQEIQRRQEKSTAQDKGFWSYMSRGFGKLKSIVTVTSEDQQQTQSSQIPFRIEPIHIQLTSDSEDCFNLVITEIEGNLNKEKCEREINNEVILQFGDEEREKIFLLQDKNQVFITIDTNDSGSIKIQGNTSDVSQVFIELHEVINNVRKRIEKTQLETMLFDKVTWMYQQQETYIPFSPKSNALIEEAYINKEIKVFIEEFGNKSVVKLKEKTMNNEGIEVMIKRKLPTDNIPVEWADMSNLGQKKFMNVNLLPSSSLYKRIAQDFTSSLELTSTAALVIEEIIHIQNPSLWNGYMTKKKSLEDVVKNVNIEKILYHGTSHKTCENINANGFNRSYCGKNATLYGDGVYFAVKADYSANDTYSPPDGNGSKYIYTARVLTGKYTIGKEGMKQPPPIDERISSVQLFDSVTDNLTNPELFVIFHDSDAYPEYLIKFQFP
ncbi:protein mono-ADP-ribosyltransferase PARP14-like isoform X2 [Lampetra planeri]